VALFHDEVLDIIDFDFGARPLAEQDAVADFDVDRDQLAALVAAAGSNGDDLALLRLLLGGVGNNYATSGLRLGIDSLDDNAVVKWSKFHGRPPKPSSKSLTDWKTDRYFERCSLRVQYFETVAIQCAVLNALDTLVLIDLAASVAASCASAQSSLFCAENKSNCLRICAVDSSINSDGVFTPNSSSA